MTENKTEVRLTSAEIKKQIEAAKTEIKDSGMPLNGMLANEINASASTPENKPIAESKPEPIQAAEQKPTGSVDLKEWAKKKGIDWTTEDSVLSALRKSDEAFHKRQQEKKSRESQPPAPNYAPQQPAYQQPYGYQQAYVPQPPNSRQIVENVARQYNMLPEDVERLAAFNRDFFETAMASERQRQAKEMEAIRVENQKNSVFRELSSDPAFRNPEVAVEFHNVLDVMQEQEPESFERDPSAYKRAYDKAMANIGRRYLEGRPLQEGVPPTATPVNLPTKPPRQLGTGSGGGSLENENGIDPKEFAKLPLEEKAKFLAKMGLKPAY